MKIAHYVIEKELGRGGMGIVYKAYDTKLERTVALKVLLNKGLTEKQIQRFVLEAKATAKLKHPNIVEIYDIGKTPENYFTMEYIEGKTISSLVSQNKIKITQAAKIIKKVAEALHYAHKNGIIHRDIKPSNIIIDKNGEPKIMDFGLVKVVDNKEQLSLSGEAIGTPSYMSPEQADCKKVTKESDIYSVGATLYEILTKRPPFQGATNYNIIYQIFENDPIRPRLLNPDTPKDLENICLKCMHKKPEKRYKNGRLLAQDIERYLNGKVVKARSVGIFEKSQKLVMRNKKESITLVILCFIGLFFYHYLFFSPGTIEIEKGEYENLQIKVNGKKRKRIFRIPSGKKVKIIISAKNYDEATISPSVKSREYKILSVNLSHHKGNITVNTSIPEVKVVLQKKEKAIKSSKKSSIEMTTPIINEELDTGEYIATFTKQNYFLQTKEIVVKHNTTSLISINLEPMLIKRVKVSNITSIQDIAIADMDNDGSIDLVTLRDDTSIDVHNLKRYKLLWNKKYQNERTESKSIQLHDINKDGVLDIIIHHYLHFRVIDGKTHTNIFSLKDNYTTSYIIHDFTGDGYDDVILFSRIQPIMLFDIIHKKYRKAYRCPPHSNKYSPLLHKNIIIYGAKKGLCFLNYLSGESSIHFQAKGGPKQGDAFIDIKKIDDDHIVYLIRNKVFLVHISSKKILWEFKIGKKLEYSKRYLAVLDIDNDNEKEVIACFDKIYILDVHKKKIKREITFDENTICLEPIFFDKDNDKKIDIIIVGGNNKNKGSLYFYDLNTNNKKVYTLSGEIKKYILTDINQNGKCEILVTYKQFIDFVTFEKENTSNLIIKQFIHPPIFATMIDVDNDRSKEIFFGDTNGNLICLYGKKFEKQCIANISHILREKPKKVRLNGKDYILAITRWSIFLIEMKKFITNQKLQAEDIRKIKIKNEAIVTAEIIDPYIFIQTKQGIYCRTDNGQILWNEPMRVAGKAKIWKQRNNINLIISYAIGNKNKRKNYISCINLKTKHKLRWTTQVEKLLGDKTSIYICDVNNDGINDVFAGLASGIMVAINGQNGQILWQKGFEGGEFGGNIYITFRVKMRKYYLTFTNRSGYIFCVNAKTGQTIWEQKANTNDSILTIKHHLLPDNEIAGEYVVSTGHNLSLRIVSCRTGRCIGFLDNLGLGIQHFSINTLNQDNKKDALLAYDNKLVIIFNIKDYFKKQTLNLYGLSNNKQQNNFIRITKLNHFFEKHLYSELEFYLSKHQKYLNTYNYLLYFYKGVTLFYKNKYNESLKYFKASKKCGNIFDNTFFILLVQIVKRENDEATELSTQILHKIQEFDRCYEKYKHLLSKDQLLYFKEIIKKAIEKSECDKKLHFAYESYLFMGKKEEAIALIPLTLKYGRKNTPGRNKRISEYLTPLYFLKKTASIYKKHIVLKKFNQAIEYLPSRCDLYYERAHIHLSLSMYQKARKDFKQTSELAISLFKKKKTFQYYRFILVSLCSTRQIQRAKRFLHKVKKESPQVYNQGLRDEQIRKLIEYLKRS